MSPERPSSLVEDVPCEAMLGPYRCTEAAGHTGHHATKIHNEHPLYWPLHSDPS
jgi:hypothetical protein